MTKKPIQKEGEYFDKQPEGDEKCRCGHIVKECYYNQINGEKHQRKEGEPLCSHCYNFSIPFDTFIEEKMKEFDKWRNDGEHCSLDDSVLNSFDVIMLKDFLKSSLQEQREIIEKEIETKIRVARSEGYLSYCKENGVEPKLGKGN